MKKMIKYLFSYLVALFPFVLGAQSQSQNYVESKTYKVATTTPINTQDPNQVSTTVQYIDELGRPLQTVMVKGGSGSYGNNQIPYDWSLGTPNNSGFYNLNGASSENQIVSGSTPFGDTDLLWECVNDSASNADGGWNTDSFGIDHTKAYRYTVWVKKSGSLSDGTTYHGVGHSDVNYLSGSLNTNPYFFYSDLPVIDTWYLLVGYVHPSGYTGADVGISGVYDRDGNKVLDGQEYKWVSGVTSTYFRNYLYYATNTSTRQYFWSPVVQQINGEEDSLGDILSNTTVIDSDQIVTQDIVRHHEYDGFGRESVEYLSYASGNSDGRFDKFAVTNTKNYYLDHYSEDFPGITDANDINAFSENIFENSPLDRVVEQTAPGLDWKLGANMITNQEYSDGHSVKMEYHINTTSDQVKKFTVGITRLGSKFSPSLSGGSTYYPEGELTKTILKDENWTSTQTNPLDHTTEDYNNKDGQLILKRAYEGNVAHDTYYIYDAYGNLTYVLPPKASDQTITQTVLDELCYQYVYDQRNRLIEKKMPGKGWEYTVYDMLDRPILTQDALQRPNRQWLFTKYDVQGRVAFKGIYTHPSIIDQSQMQIHYNITPRQIGGVNTHYESKSTSEFGSSYVHHYYTNYNFPYYNIDILTVNYYDDYAFNRAGASTSVTTHYGVNSTSDTKGLETGSKIKVLGSGNYITAVTYYDEKGRLIYSYTKNDYLQTTDIEENKLDFTGKALETKSTHQKVGKSDVVVVNRYDYDHMDRLLNHSQKINNQISERITRNRYDDLGDLTGKLTGNGTESGYTDITSGISISNDVISKTGGSCWYEGLATEGSFAGDGYVEYEANGTTNYMVGLSDSNVNAVWTTIDYAIYNEGTGFVVYENASNKGNFGQFSIGDIFRIERIGNKVYYKRNGNVFYVSEKLSSGELLGDISICGNGSPIKDLHIVDNDKGLQNVDYDYNVRGWMKSINDIDNIGNDLFSFKLNYNTTDISGSTGLFDGNISETLWYTKNDVMDHSSIYSRGYSYQYDALNRIKRADYRVENSSGNYGMLSYDYYTLTHVYYDKNGNVTYLNRRSNTSYHAVDDLIYTYDVGNKLQRVEDIAYPTYKHEGFKDNGGSGTDYTYDVNGNMISDANKGISSITYNHLNLPTGLTINGNNFITYIYDANGVKQAKYVIENGLNVTTTEYAGAYVYQDNNLQFFGHAEGYVKYENGDFENVYQYKDHLGNVRVSYSDLNDNGIIEVTSNPNTTEMLEESNYHPYGLKHKGYNSNTSPNVNSNAQKWGYQSKELNDELNLNWYDFGARNYDPALGRWMSIDPLADSFYAYSPYNAMMNNPLAMIDPDGRAAQDIITINDDGSMDRVETKDDFDIIQNESGTKKITVQHDKNGSQISEVKKANETSYVTIKNKEVATKVFEFGAEISRDAELNTPSGFEFSLDSFTFSDGYQTNTISIGSKPEGGALGGSVTPIGNYSGVDLGGGHFVEDAVWTENNHFHPSGNWVPSGFNGTYTDKGPKLTVGPNQGDRDFAGDTRAQKLYLYSHNLKGYTQYNHTSATFIGKKK